MDAKLTVNRSSLWGLVRSMSNAANRAAVSAAMEEAGASTVEMYATLARDGLRIAQGIETGKLADAAVCRTVDAYVQVARKSGL